MVKNKYVKILIVLLIVLIVLGIFLFKKIVVKSNSDTNKIENLKVSNETSVKNEVKKVLDFTSETCLPCKQLEPLLNELKEEYKDKVEFISIDVNEYTAISSKYSIAYTPTLVFLDENDKEISRVVGFLAKSKIKKIIENGGDLNGIIK